jgi:hypothetical protein
MKSSLNRPVRYALPAAAALGAFVAAAVTAAAAGGAQRAIAAGPDAQAASAAAGARYTLTPSAYGQQLKTPDGRVVWEYMTKKPENTALTIDSTACFHPVNTPSGERITAFAPDDHPHHRGVFFGWHDAEFRSPNTPTGTSALYSFNVTKADFWGWGVYASREGRVIVTRSVNLLNADAKSATVEIQNDWTIRGGRGGSRTWAGEKLVATTSERDGVYVMDLTYTITPVVDYMLYKNAFGGFDFQYRKDGTSYYTNPAGKVEYRDAHYSVPESDWPPSSWYGYVITLASGRTIGAAVLDHPSNPTSLWHQSRGLWMLNPSITALGDVLIRPNAPLTLKYRVVAHDGPTPTAVVDQLSKEWQAAK